MSKADAGGDALYKVAYDEAVRALSNQQATIDSVRDRVGLLLSAAAVTTSFLGAQALGGKPLSVASWMALASFVGLAMVALAILWPRQWEFSASPSDLIRSHMDAERSAPTMQLLRDLSLHMHRSYLENWEGLSSLVTLLQVASALLTVEVTLWIVAIASAA